MPEQETGLTKTPEIVDSSQALAIELRAQREIAISTPRIEDDVFKVIMTDLERAPEFAEDAFYTIPVGDDGKNISGLSVGASRAIQRRWKNCATASRIVGQDDESFMVEGIAVDFETNCIFRSTVRVLKTYYPRGSNIQKVLREDALNKAIQAGMAKAERNSFLKSLPEWIKARYFSKAKELAKQKGKAEAKATGKTVQERMDALLSAFTKFGIEPTRVKAYVDANFKTADDPEDVLVTMRGLYNSIRDGQVKADEVFTTSRPPAGAEGAVKVGDILGKAEPPKQPAAAGAPAEDIL